MKDFSCSFCGAARKSVKKLVPGPMVFICDGCVDLAKALIAPSAEPNAKRLGSIAFNPPIVDADARSARLRAGQDACSFCGTDSENASALLVGQVAKICDGCIAIATDIVDKTAIP